MTGVLTPTGHLWPSTYPIRVRSAGQTPRQGTSMVSGAGQLCEAPRKGCGLSEARLVQPRQSDLRRIHIPAVKDALRSVHRQVYHCPVSVQFDEPAAGDGPQKTGAAGIVEGPLRRTTEQSHRVPAQSGGTLGPVFRGPQEFVAVFDELAPTVPRHHVQGNEIFAGSTFRR
jgi:hypothetical protein